MDIEKNCWEKITRLEIKLVSKWFMSYRSIKHTFIVIFSVRQRSFASQPDKNLSVNM